MTSVAVDTYQAALECLEQAVALLGWGGEGKAALLYHNSAFRALTGMGDASTTGLGDCIAGPLGPPKSIHGAAEAESRFVWLRSRSGDGVVTVRPASLHLKRLPVGAGQGVRCMATLSLLQQLQDQLPEQGQQQQQQQREQQDGEAPAPPSTPPLQAPAVPSSMSVSSSRDSISSDGSSSSSSSAAVALAAASAASVPHDVAGVLAAGIAGCSAGATVINTALPGAPIVHCTPAYAELVGKPAAALVGQPWSDVLAAGSETECSAAAACMQRALQAGEACQVELQCSRITSNAYASTSGSGSSGTFWDCMKASPVAGSAYALVLHEDVTARKLAERQWQLREHAVASINEGISIADPGQLDAPITYVNDAFCRMTGYTREEVLGRNCRFLQGVDTDLEAVERLRSALRCGTDVTVELLNYRKDGTTFWNRLSITHVTDSFSGTVRLIGVQSDITELIERRETARALLQERAAARAAQEARERFLANMSHELRTPLNGISASAQLLLGSSLSPEQRELCETIYDSSDALLGILSTILDFSSLEAHTLPLRAEPVCLQQVLESCFDMVAPSAAAKGIEMAVSVSAECWRRHLQADGARLRQVLVAVLSNAIKFTDAGDVAVSVSLVDAQQEQQQQQQAGSAGQPCKAMGTSCSSNGSSPRGSGDSNTGSSSANSTPRQQARQAWGCQTRAALQHAFAAVPSAAAAAAVSAPSAAPVYIAASTAQRPVSAFQAAATAASPAAVPAAQPTGQKVLRISVQDTGIGMNPTTLAHVFDFFTQGAEDLNRRFGGVGLGLALCRRLADAMGAKLWAESEPGRGSTFHFELVPQWCTPGTGRAAAAGASHDHTCDGVTCCPPREPHPLLAGRTAVVDIPHAGTAAQVCQSLQQLGLVPKFCPLGAEGPSDVADMAVVSPDGVSAALQSGWKGRPIIVLGSLQELPAQLHPLVVAVAKPLKLARLATALLKACALLSWRDGKGPKLGPGALDHQRIKALRPEDPSGLRRFSIDNSNLVQQQQQRQQQPAKGKLWTRVCAVGGGAKLAALPTVLSSEEEEECSESSGDYCSGSANSCNGQSNASSIGSDGGTSRSAGSSGASASIADTWQAYAPGAGTAAWASVAASSCAISPQPAVPDTATAAAAAGVPPESAAPAAPAACAATAKPPLPRAPSLDRQPSLPLLARMAATNASAAAAAVSASPAAASAPAAMPAESAAATAAPAAAAAPSVPSRAASAPVGGIPRILVAEDNKVNQMVVVKVLQAVLGGIKPNVVENGVEVLRAFDTQAFDVVLMDIHMPLMDGLEATRRLRERFAHAPQEGPRIIALSADTMLSLRERCTTAGIDDFLTKPFRVEDLKNAIARWAPQRPPALVA